MRDAILKLEKTALALEPEAGIRQKYDQAIHQYADHFLDGLPDAKGYVKEDTSARLDTFPIQETGRALHTLLDILDQTVDRPGINPASGGHLGYIPGGGLYPSALADFLADVTNRYAGVYFANPGAVRMENQMVRWAADLVGYPQASLGTLTSGGSIANLVAITTARDALHLTSAKIPSVVIYATAQTHHSVDKAIRIAGMTESILRRIPLDAQFRMDPQALQSQIRRDKTSGLLPAIIISSLGSTDTGSVDSIPEISAIAREEALWMHVDGAYGGFFQLVPELSALFDGVDATDSYILDPHKGLFLPYGTGTVLVRERAIAPCLILVPGKLYAGCGKPGTIFPGRVVAGAHSTFSRFADVAAITAFWTVAIPGSAHGEVDACAIFFRKNPGRGI